MNARDLMAEAKTLPDGSSEKTSLLDEAVRSADAANDVDTAFEARLELMNASVRSGDIDKSLVAFTWCLAEWRKDQDRFPRGDTVLWYYKWAALEAPRFPQITRARIDAILDDLEETYRAEGLSLRPVHQQRYYAALELGDIDQCPALYEKWWATPRDYYADCSACEHSARIGWALERREDKEAVALAEELYRKRIKCAEVPHHTYGETLMSLLRLGRVDDAIVAHRTGMRMLATLEHNLAGPILDHITFLAVTGNLRSAQTLVTRWLGKALAHKNLVRRAEFFAGIALVCSQLRAAGRSTWKLVCPPPLDVASDARGNVKIEELGARAEREARKVTALFDQRNGNTYRTKRSVDDILALAKHSVDAPLRKRTERVDD